VGTSPVGPSSNGAPERRRPTIRKVALSLVGFLALAGVVGFLVTSGGSGLNKLSTGAGGSAASSDRAPSAFAPQSAEDFTVTGETSAGGAGAGAGVAAIGALPPMGLDVVKTSQLTIEVGKNSFGQAFETATLVAGRYGGYVESSSMAGTKSHSGDLTIRVPAASFDDAMGDLRELGTVERQSIQGQVVTSQFIDLQARLRTWEAQEAVLLGLMRQANSIEATLRVQNELQDVQFRIEQIKGELRVLEDQTSLATIQISMHEAGAPVVMQETATTERPSLFEAWQHAVDGFLGVVYVTVVGLGYLVPITLLAFVVWFGYRRLRPSVAPAAPVRP